MKVRYGLVGVVLITGFFSCVTSKQYKALEAQKNTCDSLNAALTKENLELKGELADVRTDNNLLASLNKSLMQDTTALGIQLRDVLDKYNHLLAENRELEENYLNLAKGKEAESNQLLSDLRDLQQKLQTREDELTRLEQELNDKAQRLLELESILAQKDQAVNDLKAKVLEALQGFKDNGLSVEIRNGKVYVSMDEKLLFASGSADVDSKGQDALKKLAVVLEKDPEINILVEGHTDNVPLNGKGCMKDNWDLSTARATSIMRILLKNSTILPSRITVAGRGEYVPLVENNSTENKARNRRSEIILTPKLNELFKILESN